MLTIYKASAGSGKTFQLTLEYLKLLFSSEHAYRHILAVTFTNKATEEMKQRIIGELNRLAKGAPSSYLALLSAQNNKTPQQIAVQADRLLHTLLHDYSAFNISTIDRFFQQTTRAFTREIGLQGGYNLVLDDQPILSEAIDNLLGELELPQNRELLQWLLQYARERISKGESWNYKKNVELLGKELFKESYKQHRDALNQLTADKVALARFVEELQQIRVRFEASIVRISSDALRQIAQAGVELTDFKGQSRSPFLRLSKWAAGNTDLPTATFYKLRNDISQWVSPKANAALRNQIESLYGSGLNQTLCDLLDLFENYPLYVSAQEVSKHIYTLGILRDIDAYVARSQQENNQLLLSDTADLLHRILAGSDTPFVYEKIGTRIDHYMIDEFQDTSQMQWDNFYPLFRESLDKGKECLIVGDIKQSIYRWRSSDWRLLSEALPATFRHEERNEVSLTTNWRSCAQIVRFNNTLFTASAALLQEQFNAQCEAAGFTQARSAQFSESLARAYADTVQKVAPPLRERSGHVQMSFLGEETASDASWTEEALSRIPALVEQLQNNGYALRDIAFLVRYKREGSRIADFLMQYRVEHPDLPYRLDIISDESLEIGSAPVIKFMVLLMHSLVAPDEQIPQLMLQYEYAVSRLGLTPSQAITRYFALRAKLGESASLGEDISLKQIPLLRRLPLSEICERILELFPLPQSNDAIFVQAFQDIIAEYTARHSSDLPLFLQWWQERGQHKSIATPKEQDAMRILTIHKSKGLAFPVVILPFCNWDLDNYSSGGRENLLWIEPETPPFDALPVLPLTYNSQLGKTLFYERYFTEKLHSYIDNLNLAYVAFTRAKEELILFAPRPSSASRGGTIASLFYKTVSDLSVPISCMEGGDFLSFSSGFDSESDVYETGSWQSKSLSDSAGIEEIRTGNYPSVSPDERLSLRLKSEGYFESPARTYGTLMHAILSRIQRVEELSDAVEVALRQGDIDAQEALRIERFLREKLSSAPASQWFAADAEVLNEMEILLPDGSHLRPDRILRHGESLTVIDYKFGKQKRTRYEQQLKGYLVSLQQMGYAAPVGYLWYVELDEIESLSLPI